MADPRLDLDEVAAAARRLRGRVLRSPLVPIGRSGVRVKAESLQPGGSFKIRGALNSLMQLDAAALGRGVVAHSSGNHAIAVALASSMVGTDATIVMPDDAPAVKRQRTLELGATVVTVGPDSAERARRAQAIAHDEGRTLVEPYDSWAVMAATGTIGAELVEDVDQALGGPTAPDGPLCVYVPVSGGGLAAGVATAVKLRRPTARVVGVEPELAADALASWRAGTRVALPAEQMARTLADGLRVRQVGERTWPQLRSHLDDVVTVSEEQILTTMRRLLTDAHLVAEPSGAVAPAAAMAAADTSTDGAVVAVLSGGNVEASLLRRVLS